MKNTILTLVTIFMGYLAHAQTNKILVVRAATADADSYDLLNQAIVAASIGDTIYLSGGVYFLTEPLTKNVHIRGTGFHGDSSMVTGPTLIEGDLNISMAAMHSSFDGFVIHGLPIQNGAGDTVVGCDFKRILFNNHSSVPYLLYKECSFSECVFNGNPLQLYYDPFDLSEHRLEFRNCLFTHSIMNPTTCDIDHCVFLGNNAAGAVLSARNTRIRNSISLSPLLGDAWGGPMSKYNMARNNLLLQGEGTAVLSSTLFKNIAVLNCTDIFLNCPGNFFDQQVDIYKTLSSSAAIDAADDGSDIGLYGGATPWVDGSMPYAPHIKLKEIAGQSNPDAQLPIHIKFKTVNH